MAANVENLGPTLLGIAWSFAALATVVVASRAYVRAKVIRRLAIDDWLIFITWALAILDSTFCTISVSWGLGRHIDTLSAEQRIYSLKYIYLCEFFSIMSPGFGRISYAFLLLQIIPPSKARKRFLWTIIATQFVVDLAAVCVAFTQCRPIQGFWDPNIPATCRSPKIQEYAGFFQGVDLLLAAFPASLFWDLNMRRGTKITLSILMGLGIFAMVCSIIKTIELQAIAKGDVSYAMCVLAIWWTLEAYMVLIAASIPTLRPLLSGSTAKSNRVRSQDFGMFYLSRPKKDDSTAHNGALQRPFVRLAGTSGPSDDTAVDRESRVSISGHDSTKKAYQSSPQPGVITKEVELTVTYDHVQP